MFALTILAAPLLSGHLYLDPGSGSYIFQLLVAALLGGAFAIKIYWKRLRSFFNKSKVTDITEEEDQQADE